MKILLVQPKFDAHIVVPPLGLGYLASCLRDSGHEVILLDCLLSNISVEKFGKIIENKSPDIVGITAMTTYYSKALEYVKEAKRDGVTTILGGSHITARPLESLKESNADLIVMSEGEETFPELADAIENDKPFSNIKGVGYKKGKKFILNPKRELIANLDEIPMPAWDLMPPKGYPPAPHGALVKRFPVAPIITSRGCSFDCKYCSSPYLWERRLRWRSPTKVVDEIELLVNDFGVKEIHFEDDNFTINKKHALEICDEIIDRKLDITWTCPNGVRIDHLDRELLGRMQKSGCYMLAFGIESGSQDILNSVNKNLDLGIISKTIKTVKEFGIETWGFFIIGLPGETRETVLRTINFAKELPLDRAQFCMFTPLPGSQIFNEWTKENKITNFDWERFNFFNIVYESKNLRKEDLLELQKKAFKEFYFRPNIMFNLLKRMKPKQFKWILKRVLSYKYFS